MKHAYGLKPVPPAPHLPFSFPVCLLPLSPRQPSLICFKSLAQGEGASFSLKLPSFSSAWTVANDSDNQIKSTQKRTFQTYTNALFLTALKQEAADPKLQC